MDLERAEEIASALVAELEPIETQNESMARNLVPVLAGFFDGEGSICMRKTKDKKAKSAHYGVRLALVNVQKEAVSRYYKRYGGSLYKEIGRKNASDIWRWVATGKAAQSALRDFRPYLVVKRYQAEVALNFYVLPSEQGRRGVSQELIEAREKLRQHMHILNQVGRGRNKAIQERLQI